MGEITKGQIREWLDREARGDFGNEAGEDFQWFADNWRRVRRMRSGELIAVYVGTVIAPVIASEWQEFFGHLRVCGSNFNEVNFPLGADPGDEAEEFGVGQLITGYQATDESRITGYQALDEVKRLKRQPASLWAQGRYLKL